MAAILRLALSAVLALGCAPVAVQGAEITTPFAGFIPPAEQAAILAGTSTFDATASLQAMLDSGGSAFVLNGSPAAVYRISDALHIRSNSTLDCKGATIKAPDAGWPIPQGSGLRHFAMLVLGGNGRRNAVTNIRILNCRLYGTKQADMDRTPKLIAGHGSNIEIAHNILENTAFEGLYGIDGANNSIRNNYVRNVGYPAGIWGSLQAIGTGVCKRCTVQDNILEDVGDGINTNGDSVVITGNVIDGVRGSGISITHEVNAGTGLATVIANNSIRFATDAKAQRRGIVIGNQPFAALVNVTGNAIAIDGTAGHAAAYGIAVLGLNAPNIASNTIDFRGSPNAGKGIYLAGTRASGQKATLANNVISFAGAADGTRAYGIEGIPGGPEHTLNVTAIGNVVTGINGTAPDHGYAYDFNATGGGALRITFAGNIKDGGILRIGGTMREAGADNDMPVTYPAGRPGDR